MQPSAAPYFVRFRRPEWVSVRALVRCSMRRRSRHWGSLTAGDNCRGFQETRIAITKPTSCLRQLKTKPNNRTGREMGGSSALPRAAPVCLDPLNPLRFPLPARFHHLPPFQSSIHCDHSTPSFPLSFIPSLTHSQHSFFASPSQIHSFHPPSPKSRIAHSFLTRSTASTPFFGTLRQQSDQPSLRLALDRSALSIPASSLCVAGGHACRF